jgi:hypothetical protein
MIWRLVSLALGFSLAGVALVMGAQEQDVNAVVDEREFSRFARTVLYLQGADAAIRSEFAVLAIDRLQHVYIAEAELARDEFSRTQEDVELLGWSAAVEQYAAQLPELSEKVGQGASVLISGGGMEGVAMEVEGRMLLLVHPRPDHQGAFERDLLHLFCGRQPCEEFTPGSQPVAAIPVSRATVEPDWTFTADGAVCAHVGIKVVFTQRTNLAGLRRLCRQLLHEILTLSDEIAWQGRYSVAIAWQGLSIMATARRPEHRVQLNAAGDSVLLVAPILHGSAGLLTELAPWMRARQAGDKAELVLAATKYGWK